jgi:hypothetical protein
MSYHRWGNRDRLAVEIIPGRPTSFLTIWAWRLRLAAMWKRVRRFESGLRVDVMWRR